jgi:fructokinase
MDFRNSTLAGAIEAGGTKFVCALGTASGEILRETCIATGSPAETLEQVADFFRASGQPQAMGIASFGPLQLDRAAPDYGFITSTPKREWRDFNLAGAVRKWFTGPVAIDTDVNAAALAENRWGAAQRLHTFLYVTIGTGIGAGAMVEGSLLHGSAHPEMGHIRIPHDRARDPFDGACPYHGDCLEGLASGRAIELRRGIEASHLSDDDPVWALEADYLALACANWSCSFSPERIILGGGVMQRDLFPRIRERVHSLLAGYVKTPDIVPSPLNNRAGVLGAIALAFHIRV